MPHGSPRSTSPRPADPRHDRVVGNSFIVHDGREFQVRDGTLRRALWALLWEIEARPEAAAGFGMVRRRRLFVRWLKEFPPGVFLGDFDSLMATPEDRRAMEDLFRGAMERLDTLGERIPRQQVDAALLVARMKPNWGTLSVAEVRAALAEVASILELRITPPGA